jgi:ABC-type Fe3+-siderophore transport system permease subunit
LRISIVFFNEIEDVLVIAVIVGVLIFKLADVIVRYGIPPHSLAVDFLASHYLRSY